MITVEDIEDMSYHESYDEYKMTETPLNKLAKKCHEASYKSGWWHNPETGEEYPTDGFIGAHIIATKLGLIASEVFEAMEGHRKGLMDDKLPHRTMIEVELSDTLVRIFDLAGKLELDLDGSLSEKMDFNGVREDHKVSVRAAGGKLY